MTLIWADDPATFSLCVFLVVLMAGHLAGDTVRLSLQRPTKHARRAR